MKVYVDIDSGTVLNGPIFEVVGHPEDIEQMCDSDSFARTFAETNGKEIS